MQSYEEFEPHASYNALMELLHSGEQDKYTKKVANSQIGANERMEKRDFVGLGIGKLQIVKDALQYIIQEDYDENKHKMDKNSQGRDIARINEGSVKVRNLQRMRLSIERSHRRAE